MQFFGAIPFLLSAVATVAQAGTFDPPLATNLCPAAASGSDYINFYCCTPSEVGYSCELPFSVGIQAEQSPLGQLPDETLASTCDFSTCCNQKIPTGIKFSYDNNKDGDSLQCLQYDIAPVCARFSFVQDVPTLSF